MTKLLHNIYRGEHFVFMGETLYRKKDGDDFEPVDGDIEGALTPAEQEWFEREERWQHPALTVVDPVRWAMDHFYWKEPKDERP